MGYRGVSYLDYQDWRVSINTFAGIGAYNEATMNVSEDARAPERFLGAYVSATITQAQSELDTTAFINEQIKSANIRHPMR
jgi:hypothetical protein